MQALIAYLVVFAAAAYVGWLLMPRRVRHSLIARLMTVAPSRRAWLARLEAGAECGACGSCKGCTGDAEATSSPAATKSELRRL